MKSRIIAGYIQEKGKTILGRIIVLTGARQTGKTTIVRHCFPDYTYLSIEDPVQKGNYLKLTASQWSHLYPRAILDEVQKEPVLIESIKSVYDQFTDPRYILLGSSQFLLMEKVKESLAGRCIIIELYPLTLPELRTNALDDTLQPSFFARYIKDEQQKEMIFPSFSLDPEYANKQNAYQFYLQYGGYPALTNTEFTDIDRREWLSMYVKTFLERDIRDLVSFRDLEPFVKLQRYLAHTTGGLVNFSNIAKETGVSVPTVQRYVLYMEISYQTVVLPAWFSNPLKKLVKAPKVHFMDNGVLQAVLQKTGFPNGNEYESAIVAEIYKQIKSYRLPITCYHLRTQDGREIDLLLETAGYFIAIEIKMTEHVNQNDARHLMGLQELLNKPLKQCFILSNDNEVHYFGDNIIALHAAAFLS
ncbi:MAG: ATP-binding protein [Candidatus Symbiothrix sp.]|jgi:predicted AAA+ superfamily ATPase|nr:ATP-binding protein [Candidatus Symbiothrix sp.]